MLPSLDVHFLILYQNYQEMMPIEILWYHAKHLWSNIEDYSDANTLKNAVINVFENIGNKYTINFA